MGLHPSNAAVATVAAVQADDTNTPKARRILAAIEAAVIDGTIDAATVKATVEAAIIEAAAKALRNVEPPSTAPPPAAPGHLPSPLLTTYEAADYLRVSHQFLEMDRITHRHGIPFVSIGWRKFYRLTDLDALIAAGGI